MRTGGFLSYFTRGDGWVHEGKGVMQARKNLRKEDNN